MTKARKLAILTGVLLGMSQPRSQAQSPPNAMTVPCRASPRIVAPKNPARTSNGSIVAGQSIVQGRIAVNETTMLEVVEYPRSQKDTDTYSSTIIIRNGVNSQYPLKNLIKGGEFFRLVEAARLCSSANTGTVFLAFETPSTGANEAFAVIRYSPQAVSVQTLPVADQGRIVVESPTDVELWTSDGVAGLGGIECDACKKRYVIEACHLGERNVRCSRLSKTVRPVSPDTFMRARIKIQ
jgi:hypothetical protein